METNPNLFEIFNTIFSESPKSPKTISLEIDVLDTLDKDQITETQLSDIFEIFLHMFIFGFKKLNLTFTEESISILKKYFSSVGIKFNIVMEQFDTNLFKDERYVSRYCLIDSKSIEDDEPLFISNYTKYNRNKLNQYTATFQYEYESMMFINFDFI